MKARAKSEAGRRSIPLRKPGSRAPRILLRSSWQTANIGDIAHTPGLLALLERRFPDGEVTLWPNALSPEVERRLRLRFPKLAIARTDREQRRALAECDFFLHGSGPGLAGRVEAERARSAGKPYGFAGITLNDNELREHRALLAAADFVFTRETASLDALCRSGIRGPQTAFCPDAAFALDLRDEPAADRLLTEHGLEPGRFLCAVPRLRWTPYWEIYPERVKPDPDRSAINEAFADRDHAKLREAIIAWVARTGWRVFVVPEMNYAVSRLRPLLFDPLPERIRNQVAVLDRYWLAAEAASVYARAAAVISFEMHSPIIAIASGTPAIYLRQPTDTRKGQVWRDLGLDDWIFEIEDSSGRAIARRLMDIGRDPVSARRTAARARHAARRRMARMLNALEQSLAWRS